MASPPPIGPAPIGPADMTPRQTRWMVRGVFTIVVIFFACVVALLLGGTAWALWAMWLRASSL